MTEEKELQTETLQNTTQETATPPNTTSPKKKTPLVIAGIAAIILIVGLVYMMGGTSFGNDPIVGKWEMTELTDVSVEGYGGYVKFESNGKGEILLPFSEETDKLYFTWELYGTKEEGLPHRAYTLKHPSGNSLGYATIEGSIGVLNIGSAQVVFEK